jgi:hypothetical protein
MLPSRRPRQHNWSVAYSLLSLQTLAEELQAQLEKAAADCDNSEQELHALREQHAADTLQQVGARLALP